MPSQTLASDTRGLLKIPVYCGRVTKTRDGGGVGEGVGFISHINLVSPRYYVLVVQLSSASLEFSFGKQWRRVWGRLLSAYQEVDSELHRHVKATSSSPLPQMRSRDNA